MKYKTITVTTNHDSAELVSSAMFDVGAEGVSILDKQDFLDLVKSDIIWDYVDENLLTQTDAVKVSTVVTPDDTDYENRLEARLLEMKDYGVNYGEIVVGEVDKQDWANEWKKYYKPIVTPQITVVPTWINYTPADGERIMRLDPGMAFGTGEHATTRMCLELMVVEGKTVIDVGCGSGILGIGAELVGA
ncbi:MAG: 50S ribosomal protein L11 methyltransferase, partial [Clostridia bacterium]|nr:50S ribosomal protein L11 methyltransferase [Clostridia bacterium]